MKTAITLILIILSFGYTHAQVIVTTLAGSTYGYADGMGSIAQFSNPIGVATDVAGNVYVADFQNNKIRKITPAGVVSTLAGSTEGYANGIGTAAQFAHPTGVATDALGNVYVADLYNQRIRKITPAGVVTTLAGSTYGFAEGTGASAQFNNPQSVATDAAGNVYVGDTNNNKIRKITPAGVVSTLAGSTQGFADGTGGAAQFYTPEGVATDASGNVYVADVQNYKIRKITPTGVVTTLAGSTNGFADGTGAAAQFAGARGVATDTAENVYVTDQGGNSKIRKITSAGVVSTLAGSTQGFADGTGAMAQFNNPWGIAMDATGNMYIGDFLNNKIRKITQTLSVTQNGIPSKITMFPNPVTTVLTIQLENGCVLDKISITDLSGKIILPQTQNSNTINVENLAPGIYILEVYSGDEKYTSKFVKE